MQIETKINYSQLFEILKQQNWWFKTGDQLFGLDDNILRTMNALSSSELESHEVILIEGPRHSGKTTIIKKTIDFLINQDDIEIEQVLYLDLEDHHFINSLDSKLLEDSLEIYKERINPSQKIYFFIDDIQKIENYEEFIAKHSNPCNDNPIKFIVTSSLKLQDKGLFTIKNIFPLSFLEFLKFNQVEDFEENKSLTKKYFYDYLKKGGLINLISKGNDEVDFKENLMDYFNSVLLEDVIEKNKIRNSRVLKQIGISLANNVNHFFSFNKVAKVLNISINTAREYMAALEESHLFTLVDEASSRDGQQSTSQAKIYALDTGLANTLSFLFVKEMLRLLANVVFIELRRHGYDVFYHRDKRNCDFVAFGKSTIVIQVLESYKSKSSKKPILDGLLEAAKKYSADEALILTDDEEGQLSHSGLVIEIKPVWKWLLVMNQSL